MQRLDKIVYGHRFAPVLGLFCSCNRSLLSQVRKEVQRLDLRPQVFVCVCVRARVQDSLRPQICFHNRSLLLCNWSPLLLSPLLTRLFTATGARGEGVPVHGLMLHSESILLIAFCLEREIYMSVCLYVCMHVCMYICVCMYVCMYVYTYINICVYVY